MRPPASSKHIAFGCALLTSLLLFAAHPASSAASEYICPPCGQVCDNRVYDHPGVCPTCGMTFIRRPAGGSKAPAFEVMGTVAIVLFPGVEIIDCSGPWGVFGLAHYDVVTVAAKRDPVHTTYGETVTPDYTFANCPRVDVLLLPGGNVPSLARSDSVMQWIRKKSAETRVTLSVCNGAYWLAQAGLLDGKPATTMHGMCDDLWSTTGDPSIRTSGALSQTST
jgi:hypothetical protein